MRPGAAVMSVLVLALVAAPAAGARAHHVRGLRVTPAAPAPNRAFTVRFRAVDREFQVRRGRRHYLIDTYQVVLRGPRAAGDCTRSDLTDVPNDVGRGARWAQPARREFGFRFNVGDTTTWCPGRWSARVLLVHTLCVVDPTEGTECRAARQADSVGRGGFRISTQYHPGCAVGDPTTVVLRTSAAVAYESDDGSQLFACVQASGRPWALAAGINVPDGYLAVVRLAGNFVAFGAYEGSPCVRYGMCRPGYSPSLTTAVVDLRTGARRDFHLADPRGTPVAGRALVLNSGGSIAWIGCPAGCDAGRELHTIDAHGNHLLDAGALDPASLRLSGSTLSWTNAGAPRSATLS
jgi:hypothetical protein